MTRTAIALILAAGVLGLVAASGVAAEVTVELVDGTIASGSQLSMSADGISITTAGGASRGPWPLEDVARVDLPDPKAASSGPDEQSGGSIALTAGRLAGTVEGFDGERFELHTRQLGTLTLPLKAVRGFTMPGGELRMLSDDHGIDRDLLVLANGDRTSGTLNAIEDGRVRFHSELGDLDLPIDRIRAVLLATAEQRPSDSGVAVRLDLAGASSLTLTNARTANGTLTGKLAEGGEVAIALDRVGMIEVVGGRLVRLETLNPAAYEQHSLDILSWQIRHGLNCLGDPMRLRTPDGEGPVTFTRGIGVHGPCRIEYALDGRFERFMALVGVDESAGRWADVNIVVRIDGEERFRADGVKWSEPARTVNLPVAGAERLELVVEAGEHFDVQDRVNWADARLLRRPGGGT